MADANVSQLEINGTTYDICDATARDSLSQYVLKAGDTMTGELYIHKASPIIKFQDTNLIIDSTNNNHLEGNIYPGVKFYDSANNYTGMHDFVAYNNGNVACRVVARNIDSSGNSVENSFNVIANKNGTKTYSIAEPDNFKRAISGYWPIYPDITRGTTPSSVIYSEGPYWYDKSNARLGFIRENFYTDGRNEMQITAFNTNGSIEQYNSIILGVKPDGTKNYSISDPTAFREAINTKITRTYQISSNLSIAQNTPTKFLEITLSQGLNLLCWSWYVAGSSAAQNINWLWSTSTTPTITPSLGTGIQVPIGYMNAGQYHTEITTFWSAGTQKIYLYGSHAGTGNLSMRAAAYNFIISFGVQA